MTNPEIGHSVIANGIHTNYIEAGSPENPPLVLIHGSGPGVTAFANWNGVIPTLAESFHVYAPDMVGFGYTDCPAELADINLDVWVSHIAGFMDALGITSAAFIGNSFGGALTLALAARHPEKVSKIVLMGAAGLPFAITDGLAKVWGYRRFRASSPNRDRHGSTRSARQKTGSARCPNARLCCTDARM